MKDFAGLLGADGPFAEKLAGFIPRTQQQQLADAVGRALQQRSMLVAEAGTGTGKTFAYLLPALLSGRRVLISTGTRTLQDQLFHRDLPAVRDVIGMPVKVALLKGRSNYLCRQRLTLTLESTAGLFDSRERVRELEHIRSWSHDTRSGEIAELGTVPESSPLWPQVTSTIDNCLGQECPEYARCWVLEARRRAQEADVVIINHHLFLADMLLKEEGFSSLLPGVDAVIVDEAHQLPEIANQYFGSSVTSRQLTDLLQDIRNEYRKTAGDVPDFEPHLIAVNAALAGLQKIFGQGGNRLEWQELQPHQQAQGRLVDLTTALQQLHAGLEAIAERACGIENCRRRIELAMLRLQTFGEAQCDDSQVRWIERHGRGFSLNLTPLDTAQRFQTCMQAASCAWILLSATLSINGTFDHFRDRLGLTETDELLLDSPFDYARNALLYLPPDLPDVNLPAYTQAVVDAALPVIEASNGRAFMLFTSHRALQEAARRLRGALDFPLLVQGEAPRRRLLEDFRNLGNAVLLGTASFWEGVDVKGPALSVVVIDRLPFASPGDPVLKARLNAMQRQGREPFMEYQLPQAVIALKQGVGRLIRDPTDTGVLMLCDPRITRKGYGRLFLASLPPMRRTRALEDVEEFLARTLTIPDRRAVAT
ncbi:MAG: ATP-dependent DNA helicase [Gammaproteobacteria bacterium]|nr:ATP-dependent DNA helicase [Gammaproteobacteria bacterium]